MKRTTTNSNFDELLKSGNINFDDITIKRVITHYLESMDLTLQNFPSILKSVGIDLPIRLYSPNGNTFLGYTYLSKRLLKFSIDHNYFSVCENNVTISYYILCQHCSIIDVIPKRKIIKQLGQTLICLYDLHYTHYSLSFGDDCILDIEKTFDSSSLSPDFNKRMETFLLSLNPHSFLYDVTVIYEKIKKICKKISDKHIVIQASRSFTRSSFVTSKIVLDTKGKVIEFAISESDGNETYYVFSNGDWKWVYYHGLKNISYTKQTKSFECYFCGSYHAIKVIGNLSVDIDTISDKVKKYQRYLGKKL